ncbi:hypothetical protein [Mucilaginibacter myungsuensis]|uniref:Uncharacterized protein n=1 Tax=Mucilaginibacter myungsuensis TaxID=649104 RepID=A0A929KYJ3_9SPHI|nr:hypothetical protein [Mucilaginibacter myungsuensis]MBE9662288.1 hypothetical protein [Mucilaginibacter myungsuensis]MDN3599275.1 hypothetical protein [Mucilaginibacter myungsuensis]
MKRYALVLGLILIVFTCCGSSCSVKRKQPFIIEQRQSISSTDSVGPGVKVISFEGATCVIFPASFGREMFENATDFKEMDFFMPDSTLISKISKEFLSKYCELLSNSKGGSAFGRLACFNLQKNYAYYDRQYLGYVTKKGTRIIRVQFVDFRQDPQNLIKMFRYHWINGVHGWYYSNVWNLFYDVNKNAIADDDDI